MPKSKVRKKRPQPRSSALSNGEHARESIWQQPHSYPPRGRPASSRPADFDIWLTATWTVRWTLLVTAAAICTTVILALVLGAKERDMQAFENAPTCAAGQSVGCQVQIPVTIQDRGQSGDKNTTYYLDLIGAAPADGQVDLPGQTALWNSVTAGDSATAIIWNGALVRIEDGGVDGDTSQAPGVQTVLVQGLLIASAVWIFTSALFAARIAESARGREGGWTHCLVPLEVPAMFAALFFPIGALIGQQSESLTQTVAIGAGFTAFGCICALFGWLRNR